MLIAYLDEFGHQGPFVSATDKKFSEHPLFGYAGYIGLNDKMCCFTACRVKRQIALVELGF